MSWRNAYNAEGDTGELSVAVQYHRSDTPQHRTDGSGSDGNADCGSSGELSVSDNIRLHSGNVHGTMCTVRTEAADTGAEGLTCKDAAFVV